MALFKRNDVYWVDIRHKGRRLRKSTGTIDKIKAQEFHDQIKSDLWRVEKLGDKPRRTWKEAVVRWLQESQHKKSLPSDKRRLKLLHYWLGEKYLDEIDRELVDVIKYERAEQNKLNSQGQDTGQRVTKAEVNRLLALLRSILRAACDDWEWVEKVPKVKLFKEENRRVRWLSDEELKRLLNHLPDHLRAIFLFAVVTGLREQNILGLTWKQVDLSKCVARVDGEYTKNGQSLSVPLNKDAMHVLESRKGQHEEYVFTYKGKRIRRANNSAWRRALENAGISDFRFHDARHCFASAHAQRGTPLNVIQALGGWETTEMVRRYAHLSPDNLARAAANSLVLGHKMDTLDKTEESRA